MENLSWFNYFVFVYAWIPTADKSTPYNKRTELYRLDYQPLSGYEQKTGHESNRNVA